MVLVPPVEHTVVDSLRIEEAWAPSSRQGPALLVLMSPSFFNVFSRRSVLLTAHQATHACRRCHRRRRP